MNQKQKNPYRALLAIPIAVLWNIVLFWLAVFVDTKILPDPSAHGHPVPIFTGFCILGLPGIDLVIVLVVVFITIVRVTKMMWNASKASENGTWCSSHSEKIRLF